MFIRHCKWRWKKIWHIILDRPLPKLKNKRVIRLMEDKLGGKIMTEFVALRPKTYSHLIDDSSFDKNQKEKMCNKTNTQV